MTWTSLFVRIEAKSGKEHEVAKFLNETLSRLKKEFSAGMWVALRLGPATFGIVESFPDGEARQAKIHESLASALSAAVTLFVQPPVIEPAGIETVKVAPKPASAETVVLVPAPRRTRRQNPGSDVIIWFL